MPEASSKSELRALLRERRRSIPRERRTAAATAAAEYLEQLPPTQPHPSIALYLPADGELDTQPLAERCRAAGAELFLPVVTGGGIMHFVLWERDCVMQVNRYGIPEPGPEYPRRPAEEMDIVFLPLVGWDEFGTRLGMGGGFYDRALAGADSPLRVGLGYECQQVSRLPADDWDVPMDFVATETSLHRCRSPE